MKLNYYLIPILYTLVIFTHYLPLKFGELHFGKDGGGIFRTLAILVINAIYFFIIKRFKLIWLLLGFLNGFFTFVILLILAFLLKWIGFPYFSISPIISSLIIMTIIIITGNVINSKK